MLNTDIRTGVPVCFEMCPFRNNYGRIVFADGTRKFVYDKRTALNLVGQADLEEAYRQGLIEQIKSSALPEKSDMGIFEGYIRLAIASVIQGESKKTQVFLRSLL